VVDGLFFETEELSLHEFNRLVEVLAAVLELALHLAATRQVVADDRLVVSVERVRILCLHHYLVGFEKALHACLPLRLLRSAQFFDGLFIETGQETHELFVPFNDVLVARLLEALLRRADCAHVVYVGLLFRIVQAKRLALHGEIRRGHFVLRLLGVSKRLLF